MSRPYPGSKLSIEQLVHAMVQNVQDSSPNSQSGRKLLELGPHKIADIEQNLSRVLQVFRVVKNAHIPVNKLPPDILSRVLELRDHESDLIAATHVCQHWRWILTSTPSLWTWLQFESSRDVDRTMAYLKRSKSATIDIRINTCAYRVPELFQRFAQHLSRARSIVIQGPPGVYAVSSLLLSNPAPTLESLEIYAREGPEQDLHGFLGQQAPSLRSVILHGISPVLEPPLSLPSLTTFHLNLPDAGRSHLTSRSLFQFLSTCPLLQEIEIGISSETFEGVALDRVISLESLVKLEYRGFAAGRVLPHLRLPRLRRLGVTSTWLGGQMHKLVDVLPHGGRVLLAEATKIHYSSGISTQSVVFFAEGTHVSVAAICPMGSVSVDWFSDGSCIPFKQIRDLNVEGLCIPPTFSFDPFENLTIFRLTSFHTEHIDGFLRSLYPDPGRGIPCPFLREIRCTSRVHPGQIVRSIISLVRERDQAGYRLELVCIFGTPKLDDDLEEELKSYVGELQVRFLEEST